MPDLIMYLLIGMFFTHELDAIKRHEWKIFPFTCRLPEPIGEQTFIWAHVPLFAALVWAEQSAYQNEVRTGLAAFAIIHVGLHWIYRNHPDNEFNNASSWSLIIGTGILGALYLVLDMAGI